MREGGREGGEGGEGERNGGREGDVRREGGGMEEGRRGSLLHPLPPSLARSLHPYIG